MTEVITIEKQRLMRIERNISALLQAVKKPEFITEEETCVLLNLKPETISKYCSNGTIPSDYYIIGVFGKRFFNKQKLMGI